MAGRLGYSQHQREIDVKRQQRRLLEGDREIKARKGEGSRKEEGREGAKRRD